MKTAELTGAALDWAVAKCNGDEPHLYRINTSEPPIYAIKCKNNAFTPAYHYDWSQGGPIVEQKINRLQEITDGLWEAEAWGVIAEGPTALVAAMRCYVAVELGDEVDVPEELR